MEYVRQEITGFVYSNIEDDWDEWNPITTYILEEDDTALTNASMVLFNGYYYRSVTNNNLGKNPEQYNNVYWYRTAVSNRNAMLDQSAQSKSTKVGEDLVVIFEQGTIETLGIGYYNALSIVVEILAEDMTTVLSTFATEDMTNNEVIDYWSYMYSDYGTISDRALRIKLDKLGAFVRVTFVAGGDAPNPDCGFLFGGKSVFMGNTLYGVNFNFNSYAIKDISKLGTLTITKGAVQDLVDFECDIETRYTSQLRRDIKSVYNDIVMFILDERDDSTYENLITLGIIQDASILMSNSVLSTISYSIMEAI